MTSRSGGFTLIELLIVIFIISIVTCIALLTVGRNENKEVENFTKQLADLLILSQEQAMLAPAFLGFSFDQKQYQFLRYEKNWVALADPILKPQKIPSTIQLNLAGKPRSNPPITMATNGDVTPYKLYVGKHGEKPSYLIEGDANGRVTIEKLAP